MNLLSKMFVAKVALLPGVALGVVSVLFWLFM